MGERLSQYDLALTDEQTVVVTLHVMIDLTVVKAKVCDLVRNWG